MKWIAVCFMWAAVAAVAYISPLCAIVVALFAMLATSSVAESP